MFQAFAQIAQLAQKPVVFGVRDLRIIKRVVSEIVMANLFAKRFDFFSGSSGHGR